MRLHEKGKTDGDPIHMGWDEAQAALKAGTHVSAEESAIAADDDADGATGKTDGDGLEALTRPELAKLAEERGLEVSAKATADDIVKALRAPPAK